MQWRWLALIPGVALIASTALSVLCSLVVPRAIQSRVLRVVGGKVVSRLFSFAARHRKSWAAQDRVLAFAGPVALLAVFGTWLAGFLLGYGLILWPLDHLSLLGAMREAGSSVFTLGTASSARALPTVVNYAAAGTGLLVVALEIAYVPTLYSAFNRREVLVTLLQGRAGVPAWGPELLARHEMGGMLPRLGGLYADWEVWAADVAESHTNYPILLFFRSPHRLRSWLLGLVAVIDSAALYLSLCPDTAPIEARMVLRMGFEALREIAAVLRIPVELDPRPSDPIQLTEAEFHEGIARLMQVGFGMERSEADAWLHFKGWRVNYEATALTLARVLNAPPAPWSGPRNGVAEIEPLALLNRTPDDPDGATPTRWRRG